MDGNRHKNPPAMMNLRWYRIEKDHLCFQQIQVISQQPKYEVPSVRCRDPIANPKLLSAFPFHLDLQTPGLPTHVLNQTRKLHLLSLGA